MPSKKRLDSLNSMRIKSNKILSFYPPLILLFSIALACISFTPLTEPGRWNVIIGFQLAAFLVLGILHVWLSKNVLRRSFSSESDHGFKNTVKLTIAIFCGLAFFFYLSDSRLLILCIACSAAFILPYLTIYTYTIFESIPVARYKPWYKQDNLIENKAFVFLTSVPVRIKVSPSIMEARYSAFKSVVPAQMELSKIFHYFIIQQQNSDVIIETKDEDGEQVGWQFYLQKLWGFQQIPLNPNLNLWENQIKPKNTIVARRFFGSSEIYSLKIQQNKHHEISQY